MITLFDVAILDNTAFIPESFMADTEKQRFVSGMIERLSPIDKIIMQYYFYENVSVSDIAEKLNVTKKTDINDAYPR